MAIRDVGRGLAWGLLLAMAAGAGAKAAEPVYCPIRLTRSDAAWAAAVVRADTLRDSGGDGRGDHCDVQDVEGSVLRVLKGDLRPGQTVRFTLSQGACGTSHSVNNAFVARGGEQLVVLFARAADGRLYQVQAETPQDYAANEKACGR